MPAAISHALIHTDTLAQEFRTILNLDSIMGTMLPSQNIYTYPTNGTVTRLDTWTDNGDGTFTINNTTGGTEDVRIDGLGITANASGYNFNMTLTRHTVNTAAFDWGIWNDPTSRNSVALAVQEIGFVANYVDTDRILFRIANLGHVTISNISITEA